MGRIGYAANRRGNERNSACRLVRNEVDLALAEAVVAEIACGADVEAELFESFQYGGRGTLPMEAVAIDAGVREVGSVERRRHATESFVQRDDNAADCSCAAAA